MCCLAKKLENAFLQLLILSSAPLASSKCALYLCTRERGSLNINIISDSLQPVSAVQVLTQHLTHSWKSILFNESLNVMPSRGEILFTALGVRQPFSWFELIGKEIQFSYHSLEEDDLGFWSNIHCLGMKYRHQGV